MRYLTPRSAVLAACVLGATTLTGCGSSSGGSNGGTRQETIELVSVTFDAVFSEGTVDTPPVGKLNAGDHAKYNSRLDNAAAQFGKAVGDPVGQEKGSTETVLAGGQVRYDGTAELPDGTITYSGDADSAAATFTLPVTAGTGAYQGATGTLTVGPTNGTVPQANTNANTYDLILPPIASS